MHVTLIADPDEARGLNLARIVAHEELDLLQATDQAGLLQGLALSPRLCLVHRSLASAEICAAVKANKGMVVLLDESYAGEAGRVSASDDVATLGADAFLALPPVPDHVRRGAEQVVGIKYPTDDATSFLASIGELERIYALLETASYYELLGIAPDASAQAARDVFHSRATLWHPDRFAAETDAGLRLRAYEVYKRIAEAYRVITSPETRARYDIGLKLGRLRFVQEQAKLKRRDEDRINEKARRFFDQGMVAMRSGDMKAARNHLRLAQQLDPKNPLIKKRLKECSE